MRPQYKVSGAICFVIAFLLLADKTIAQIPNPGFENWTGGGDPVDWVTQNDPPTFVNVTQAAPGHSGSFALQGSIVSVSGFAVPVVIVSGPDGAGYPNTSRPAALHGWFKFSPVSGDVFYVSIVFQKNGQGMAAGSFITSATQGAYSEFVANIVYLTGEDPDTAVITAQILNTTGFSHVGSVFTLDDLAYGAASADVRVDGPGLPENFSLSQNYPNPFNPTTTIRYELPQASYVRLEIFNLLGREVATLVDGERAPGVYTAEFNALNISSGTYFYKLQAVSADGQAGGFTDVKRLMLLK